MRPHWPRLKAMNLNTVLAPVSWELIEPVEGKFDWTSVDELLRDARAHDLKLVILWFGAWKNSMSTYVPSWVKRDQTRFPRAQLANGSSVEILSAFSANTRDADVRAFGAFMEYLKRVDGDEEHRAHGAGGERDRHVADRARARRRGGQAVRRARCPPSSCARSRRVVRSSNPSCASAGRRMAARRRAPGRRCLATTNGAPKFSPPGTTRASSRRSWSAGKKRYDIPLFVNVALNRTGRKPGEYPSGGPLPHLLDVWKAGAPTLDFLAPDIYFPNFAQLAARFNRADNMLFIPKPTTRRTRRVRRTRSISFGELDSLGFSPFSIESLGDAPNALSRAYEVLEQLTPIILENRGRAGLAGFRATIQEDGTVIDSPVKKIVGAASNSP